MLGRAVLLGAALVASWWLLASPASADESGTSGPPGAADALAAVVDPLAAAISPAISPALTPALEVGSQVGPQTAISTTGDAGPAPTVDEVAATVAPVAPAVAGPAAPSAPASPLRLLDGAAPVVAGARGTVEQVAQPLLQPVAGTRSAVEQVAKPLLDPVKGAVAPVADPVVGAVRPIYDPVAANVLTPLYTPAAVVAPDDLASFLVDPVAALEGHAWSPAAFAANGTAGASAPAVTDAVALGAGAGTVVPGPAGTTGPAGPDGDSADGADAEGLSRHLAVPTNMFAADGSARGDAPTVPAPPAPVDPASSRGSLPAAPAGPASGLAGGGSATGARDVPDRGHGAVADAVAGVRAMASDRRALAVPRVVGASVNAGSRPAVTPD